MLRCHFCGKHAMAGLAHLHGLAVPLCTECTEKVTKKLKFVKCSTRKERARGELVRLQCTTFDPDEPSLRAA